MSEKLYIEWIKKLSHVIAMFSCLTAACSHFSFIYIAALKIKTAGLRGINIFYALLLADGERWTMAFDVS